MILHLTATTEQAGQRLDAFVAAACEGVSRSAAARLLEGGFITVNGKAATKSKCSYFKKRKINCE